MLRKQKVVGHGDNDVFLLVEEELDDSVVKAEALGVLCILIHIVDSTCSITQKSILSCMAKCDYGGKPGQCMLKCFVFIFHVPVLVLNAHMHAHSQTHYNRTNICITGDGLVKRDRRKEMGFQDLKEAVKQQVPAHSYSYSQSYLWLRPQRSKETLEHQRVWSLCQAFRLASS